MAWQASIVSAYKEYYHRCGVRYVPGMHQVPAYALIGYVVWLSCLYGVQMTLNDHIVNCEAFAGIG